MVNSALPAQSEAAVARFLRENVQADLIEVVIDTTPKGEDMVPFVNLWAWSVSASCDLSKSAVQVEATGDLGFLYDFLDEQASSCFEVEASCFYPEWPDGLKEGDEQLLAMLRRACASDAGPTVVFHHVDTWPLVDPDGRRWR